MPANASSTPAASTIWLRPLISGTRSAASNGIWLVMPTETQATANRINTTPGTSVPAMVPTELISPDSFMPWKLTIVSNQVATSTTARLKYRSSSIPGTKA